MHNLRFDNAFVRELPGDPEQDNRARQVQGALYTRVAPTAVAAPRLLAYSREVAALLDIDAETVATPRFAEIFGGNAVLADMQPYAANYGGHQFGHWAGQLGDGRAITLGEIINAAGQRWELQLNGAGPTAARCCVRPCANFCAAKPCITSACPPPARSAWSISPSVAIFPSCWP